MTHGIIHHKPPLKHGNKFKLITLSTGRIDVSINNAGLIRIGPLLEQPIDEVREVLETNVIGQLCLTQESP